jgi:hypothetical protein
MAKKKSDGDSDSKLFDREWSSSADVRDEAKRNREDVGGHLPTHTNTARQDAAVVPRHRSGERVSRELVAGRNQGRHAKD